MAKMQDFADQIAQQGLRLAATESMDSGQIVNLCKLWPLAMVTFMRNLSMAATSKFPWEEEIPVSGNILYTGRDYIRREPLGCLCGYCSLELPHVYRHVENRSRPSDG